jgi:DNA/RNA-binding domain of Phe-tRNA-synthetase-like protein
MRGDFLSGILRPGGIPVLRVRNELDIELVSLELYELEVTEPREDFELEVARATQAAKSETVGGIAPARVLYRRFGIDPTRVRPSSEALLRRLKKGEPLPRINSLVDVANALSVQLQVPVGLYDLDKVKGQGEGDDLAVRLGAEGESYIGIGKEKVNVAGRICVADAEGPCGNPSSDSARTMITTATERAAWIYFLPVSDDDVDRTAELIAVFGRGLVRMSV